MKTEVLIIGGGIAGLTLAQLLARSHIAFHMIEARTRLGGRMLTETVQGGAFDLGPAWFWPGQPGIAALADAHGITVFEQYAEGILTYEDEKGRVKRGRGYASMQGSLRLDGGFSALINAMAATLSPEQYSLDCPVSALTHHDDRIIATTPKGYIEAKRVVLALPPRLIAANITFNPALSPATASALNGIPTWMAGQAKALAIYEQPFWREDGLSGDAMSRHGPMVEVHDASPAEGGPYGLFGFIGVPPHHRQDEYGLKAAILAQLQRLFGPRAAEPLAIIVKDWAADPHTATTADLAPLYAHPAYGMPRQLQGVWDGRLLFSGTETANQAGGVAEGAVEAAERSFASLMKDSA